MGGGAFQNLDTPRMPPEIYFTLRDRYKGVLELYFPSVAVPIEAPGKTSYGDIDYIVINAEDSNIAITEISIQLHTTAVTSSWPTKSLAIPCPELGVEKHVQIDIHVCEAQWWPWQVFHHAHGDFWNLLGSCIRDKGFTADEHGFHIRVEEIELLNKKASRVMLTGDPAAALEFLGLDFETYNRPFETPEQMYTYMAGNRLFRRRKFIKEDLKRNDRVRMGKRNTYRLFVNKWLPEHPELEDKGDEMSREEWLKESLRWFGKKQAYEEKVRDWQEEQVSKAKKKQRHREAQCAAYVGCYGG